MITNSFCICSRLWTEILMTPSSFFRYPGKQKAWDRVKLKDLRGWLAKKGFNLKQCTPGIETVEAFQDLEEGSFSIKQVPHYSLLVKKMELLTKRKQAGMSMEEYEKALQEKPSDIEVLVRKMDKPPLDYDESIWGPFPPFLYVLCLQFPSQNQKVEAEASWNTCFLFLSNTPNTKLDLKPPLDQLWMWYCGTRKAAKCSCSRLNGSGMYLINQINFSRCIFL